MRSYHVRCPAAGQQAVKARSCQQGPPGFLAAEGVWAEDMGTDGIWEGGDCLCLTFCCFPRYMSDTVPHIQRALEVYF